MAGRRRTGVLGGAINVASQLLLHRQEEQRKRRDQATELALKFKTELALDAAKQGMAFTDPFSGTAMPAVTALGGPPAVGAGQRLSATYDRFGRPKGYSTTTEPAPDPVKMATQTADLQSKLLTGRAAHENINADIAYQNAQANADWRRAHPVKSALGLTKTAPVALSPDIMPEAYAKGAPLDLALQLATQRLSGLVAPTATGISRGDVTDDLPSDLPDIVSEGAADGDQFQSAEDGGLYEVQGGQWVKVQ